MDEQIEAGEIGCEIGLESSEPDTGTETATRDRRAQRCRGRPASENQDASRGGLRAEARQRRQQHIMPLAWNQLPDDRNEQTLGIESEAAYESAARRLARREARRVDGARDARDARGGKPELVNEPSMDRARDRDYACEAAKFPACPARGLAIVDAPRQERRQPLGTRRKPTEDVGTSARMHVHEIGSLAAQYGPHAPDRPPIKISVPRHVDDARGGARSLQRRIGPADQDVVDAVPSQARQQRNDLARTAVEVPS